MIGENALLQRDPDAVKSETRGEELRYASQKGHLAVVKCLLERGVNVDDVDEAGSGRTLVTIMSSRFSLTRFCCTQILLISVPLPVFVECRTGQRP